MNRKETAAREYGWTERPAEKDSAACVVRGRLPGEAGPGFIYAESWAEACDVDSLLSGFSGAPYGPQRGRLWWHLDAGEVATLRAALATHGGRILSINVAGESWGQFGVVFELSADAALAITGRPIDADAWLEPDESTPAGEGLEHGRLFVAGVDRGPATRDKGGTIRAGPHARVN